MTLEFYQHAISAHFPDLCIHSIAFYKEGWGNRLCLVNGAIVFRFPVDPHGAHQLEREIRLLPILAPELPLPIPTYQYVAPASDAYPYPFVGYPLIPGASYPQPPVTLREAIWWRPAVGDFLTALHRIPIQKVVATGIEGYETSHAWRDALAQKHGPYEQHIFPLISAGLRQNIRRYLREAIRDERMMSFSPVVIHQDFDFYNILVDLDAQQVTGIVDFGMCSIGDPVVDVSQEIRPYYRGEVDPGWDFRRDYYRRTSALEDLLYLCTCDHGLPDGEAVRSRKLLEIAQIWSGE